MRSAQVSLDPENIEFGNVIEIVPAPQAGYAIVPIMAYRHWYSAPAPYYNQQTISFWLGAYKTGASIGFTMIPFSVATTAATNGSFTGRFNAGTGIQDFISNEAQPLNCACLAGGTGGSGNVVVTVFYELVKLA
jgi:hypothetical protein